MPKRTETTLDDEISVFTIGAERVAWLGNLISIARADHKPRNFAECQLVDDLAISRWRCLRAAVMEKAVFEQQATTFRARAPKDKRGRPLQPHEDICHLAMAYAPEAHAAVLAAIHRLEARYHRHFCTALRLLIALRRGTPPPVASAEPQTKPLDANTPTTSTRKETATCEPSPITPPAM